MEYFRKPLIELQTKQSNYKVMQSEVADLETRLDSLRDLVQDMQGTDTLRKVAGSSSDNTVLTVSSASGAHEGSHSVQVNQLATAERRVQSTGLAALTTKVGVSKSTALNTGGMADADAAWFTAGAGGATYTFDFGDEADITDVTFAADTSYSLNDVAAIINVRSQAVASYDAASVEFDTQTSKYYLRLTAKNASATGTVTQTLTAGDAIAELGENTNWTKTAVNTGAFVYTYGGTTRTINVSSDTTLDGLRNLINNDAQNPGVTASVLQYGSTYHLVLSGDETGASHTITVNDLATTIDGFDSGDYVVSQSAASAQFRVDGFPDGAWLERDSNSVSDVLPGVTLSLKKAGTATVILERDTSGLKTDLTNLVSIYNGLVDKIKAYAGYDSETKTSGLFQGDSTISNLLSGIRDSLVGGVGGFYESDGDSFHLASQLGLSFDKEGHMSFDSSKFSDALSTSYQGVLSLMGAYASGTSDSSSIQFYSSDPSTTLAGKYDVEVDFDALGTVTAGRIRVKGTTEWKLMSVTGNKLTGILGSGANGLVLTAAWDGHSTTQTANVRVQEGFGVSIYKKVQTLLDPVDGILKTKKDGLTSQADLVAKQLEAQETRLDAQETILREKYARMEEMLAQLDGQKQALDQLVQSLNNNNND
jgi:flagellar hook-associated protein 2